MQDMGAAGQYADNVRATDHNEASPASADERSSWRQSVAHGDAARVISRAVIGDPDRIGAVATGGAISRRGLVDR